MAKYLSNIDLNKNQLQNAVVHPLGTPPSSPSEGQIYYNSTIGDKELYYYNGSAWIGLTSDSNNYLTSLSFNTANGVLLAEINGLPDVTVSLDGRYALLSNIPTNIVETITTTDSTFIDLTPNTAVDGNVTVTANLSATGTPSSSTYLRGDNTWAALPGNPTITLSGEVTGSGTTSISTTVADGVLDVANFNASAIVTESEGIENNNNDTTLPTSAAVKAYVDSATVGGLVYQGGYNAATNTPNLDDTPIVGIKKGWTYTVTADGLFFTEQVRVGDVIISEIDSPTTLADWTTVQNNIDLSSASQVGIGNVAEGTGVSVSYSNGTATVTNTDRGSSQNIFKNIAVSGQSTVIADSNNDTLTLVAGSNISIATNATTDTITISNTYVAPTTSYAVTISDTSTITHNLNTRDVIIQLYDAVTFETVYADVDRVSTTQATIAFATTPTNSIRVLVQKIG